jgi:integrase
MTRRDLKERGIDAPPPTDAQGKPLLSRAPAHPMTRQQAIAASTALKQIVADMPAEGVAPQSGRQTRQRSQTRTPGEPMTVGDLLDAFFNPALNGRLFSRKEKTIASYKSWRAPVDEVFEEEPLINMDEDLIEEWFDAVRRDRGHRMAYGAYQLLRRAWNWGRRKYKSQLPEILWKEIETPIYAPKLRVASDTELAALIMAMDDPAGFCAHHAIDPPEDLPPPRPELADSLILALWTTQRASDVLSMNESHLASGRLRMLTGKRETRIDMPILPPLQKRLSEARMRRQARGATCENIILHPERDRPYTQKTHNKHFVAHRKLAAIAVPSLIGEGLDEFQQANKVFTFEDLRDTGITRLFRSGCTVEQIISWSNHSSADSLRKLIDSYISIDGEIADQVGERVMSYVEAQGIAI